MSYRITAYPLVVAAFWNPKRYGNVKIIFEECTLQLPFRFNSSKRFIAWLHEPLKRYWIMRESIVIEHSHMLQGTRVHNEGQ